MPSRGAFGAAKAEKSKARDRRLICTAGDLGSKCLCVCTLRIDRGLKFDQADK